jgi:hypothetical protein
VALNFKHLAGDPNAVANLNQSQSGASRKTSGFCDYYIQNQADCSPNTDFRIPIEEEHSDA